MVRINPKYYAFFLLAIIAILFWLGLSSCANERKFVRFHEKHDTTALKHCSEWAPIRDSVRIDWRYKEGKPFPVTVTKEVYKNCDSAFLAGYYQATAEEGKRGGKDKKKNPPIIISHIPPAMPLSRVDTVFRDSTITRKSTADSIVYAIRYHSLEAKYSKLSGQCDIEKADKLRWRKRALYEGGGYLILIIALIIFFYLRMKSSFIRKGIDAAKNIV